MQLNLTQHIAHLLEVLLNFPEQHPEYSRLRAAKSPLLLGLFQSLGSLSSPLFSSCTGILQFFQLFLRFPGGSLRSGDFRLLSDLCHQIFRQYRVVLQLLQSLLGLFLSGLGGIQLLFQSGKPFLIARHGSFRRFHGVLRLPGRSLCGFLSLQGLVPFLDGLFQLPCGHGRHVVFLHKGLPFLGRQGQKPDGTGHGQGLNGLGPTAEKALLIAAVLVVQPHHVSRLTGGKGNLLLQVLAPFSVGHQLLGLHQPSPDLNSCGYHSTLDLAGDGDDLCGDCFQIPRCCNLFHALFSFFWLTNQGIRISCSQRSTKARTLAGILWAYCFCGPWCSLP